MSSSSIIICQSINQSYQYVTYIVTWGRVSLHKERHLVFIHQHLCCYSSWESTKWLNAWSLLFETRRIPLGRAAFYYLTFRWGCFSTLSQWEGENHSCSNSAENTWALRLESWSTFQHYDWRGQDPWLIWSHIPRLYVSVKVTCAPSSCL